MNNVMQYIETKKLFPDVLTKFNIGIIEDKGCLTSYDFPKEGVDLIKRIEFKRKEMFHQDLEQSLVIPYFSLYNELLGIAVRLVNQKPKFDSTSFKKSEHLFNLNNSWKSILEQKYVILTEGQFDVIGLVKEGIENVAAICGSSFSFTQLCLLRRFCKKVVLVLDGDKVGREKSKQIKVFIEFNSDIKCKSIDLGNDLDPDDFVNKYGKDKFLGLVG